MLESEDKFTVVFLTLGEGGVRGTASFSEANGRAVVRLPVLGSEGGHRWVGRPSRHKRRRGDTGGRAVGWHYFTERGGIL